MNPFELIGLFMENKEFVKYKQGYEKFLTATSQGF
jgi:hypothetical protein